HRTSERYAGSAEQLVDALHVSWTSTPLLPKRISQKAAPYFTETLMRATLIALRTLFVLPILHQVIHHPRVRQRRGVAERAVVVLGDLAQDAAHDFARARLGQPRRELDQVGLRDRA